MAHSTSYWDIPVQTEKKRQYLSEFQTKNLLNDQIDYLLDKENWIPTDWRESNRYGSPKYNYGQKIADPEAWSGHRGNPQATQNIWRIHGEGDYENTGLGDYAFENEIPLDWGELDRLYGEERYTPNMQGNTAPNWDYIDSLELFRDSGNRIGIMNTADAYKDIDRGTAEANVGGVNVGEKLTGTGGFYNRDIILNPANVVKKYPTAPMGPDSEWEFLGPKEQGLSTDPEWDDNWNMYRILPHETGHHKARRDFFYDWDDPNPGAYLEGIGKKDYYSDHSRHPMMHTMDRLLHDQTRRHSLSKTQYQNFLHHQDRGRRHSTNRGYDHPEDWRNAETLGSWGSGRSRIEDRGRPMYQSQSSQAIIPSSPGPLITKPDRPPGQPDRPPGQPVSGPHGFNTGGIAGLPGQWSPSTLEGNEETFDIKSLGLDPGIMSIDDLEDLFEEAGLDKRIIYELINSGGLSQLVS